MALHKISYQLFHKPDDLCHLSSCKDQHLGMLTDFERMSQPPGYRFLLGNTAMMEAVSAKAGSPMYPSSKH
jgi:hypothetical protein